MLYAILYLILIGSISLTTAIILAHNLEERAEKLYGERQRTAYYLKHKSEIDESRLENTLNTIYKDLRPHGINEGVGLSRESNRLLHWRPGGFDNGLKASIKISINPEANKKEIKERKDILYHVFVQKHSQTLVDIIVTSAQDAGEAMLSSRCSPSYRDLTLNSMTTVDRKN